jgi:alcohol dehydrogenase class IV
MAWAFGIDTRGMSREQAAAKAVDAATAFITDMGIPRITDVLPTTAADIPMLKKETLETTGVPITPEMAQAVWEEIYR